MNEENNNKELLNPTQVFRRVFDSERDRLRVDAAATISSGHMEIQLDHTEDSVKIGDGSDILGVNPDGSVSARITDGYDTLVVNNDGSITVRVYETQNEITQSIYGEKPLVPSSSETVVLRYQVPALKQAFLHKAEASGENIARFKIYLNGATVACKRTHFGSGLNVDFAFGPDNKTLTLGGGDVVELRVEHQRPETATFEGRVLLTERE